MKRWAIVILIGTTVVLGAVVWANYVNWLNAVTHETNRWVVIKDVNGDIMAVEPTRDNVWSELVQMNENGTIKFVGGIVERYSNKWGFRFKPDNVIVTEFVAEGLQATIRYISENIDYWENGWSYVLSRVVEIHS